MENQEEIVITPTPKTDTDFNNIINNSNVYSIINNATCNCKTIRILKNLLSGRNGILTNIHTYLYYYFLINKTNPDLASVLNSIILTNLTHAKLLGDAIILFGGNPKFSNGQGSFWSARNVNYQSNINSFINDNISREQQSIKNFEQASSSITNESLKLLLGEIIKDKNDNIKSLTSFNK